MSKSSEDVLRSILVCIFYGLTSLSMGLLNKVLLSTFSFDSIFLLLTVQMVLQILFCEFTRDNLGNPLNVPKYDWNVHKDGLVVGILYISNVSMGLIGLSLVNLPMFFCIRRLVAPTIVLYEFILYRKTVDPPILYSIIVIIIGALLAGIDTLNTDVLGYTLTMLNNLTTAATSVSQKRFSEKQNLNASGVLYYNALTALPLSAILCIALGEVGDLFTQVEYPGPYFWVAFFGCCVMGPILTYSSMLCTTYNSPLAMSITGTVKDIMSTTLGAVLFPGFKATVQNVSGLFITFIGASLYSVASLLKKSPVSPHVDASRDILPYETQRDNIIDEQSYTNTEDLHLLPRKRADSRRSSGITVADRDPEDV